MVKSIEGYDVTVENVSSDYGQLAIQGPNARALVQNSLRQIYLT